ncbi:Transcriptional regulator, PadR-like family [Nostocoides japonicum T1-X7]|uniref:Transcriptional regulator, PadR-like family n=1 Tax=Nostocoides japonicum T1-X7 TaxID=1194083 RepID=A0A077LUF4_9MICO|nr:Transcriptional regulator, PadR-like family [Tetrasphaera japonica T1-X7]
MVIVSTGHVLLGLLSRGRQHGYDLKRSYDALLPAGKPVAYGQVYAALDRLHRRGLVEVAAVQRADGPDRVVYALTESGRDELEAWMTAPEDPGEQAANPMAAHVGVALTAGGRDAAVAYLVAQRAVHLDRMRGITRMVGEPGAPLSQALSADFSLAHLDADMRWIEATLDRLDTLEKELDG